MGRILISLIFIFILTGCGTAPKISNLSEFKGCTVQYASIWFRGNYYTSFTAYCNGEFKKGIIPIRVDKIQTIQNLIDGVKIAENK